MLLKKNKKVLLDIGDQGCRFIYGATAGADFVIEHAEEVAGWGIDEGFERLAAVCNNRSRDGIATEVCFRPNLGIIHRIDQAGGPGIPDDSTLAGIVEDQIKVNLGDYHSCCLNGVNGHMVGPDDFDVSSLLVSGVHKDELAVLQEKLLKIGLYPTKIELGGLANLSYLFKHPIQKEEPTIYLEVCGACTYITVMYGGQMHVIKTLLGGLNDLLPIVQEQLGLDDIESAKDILLSGTFDFRDNFPQFFAQALGEIQSSVDYFEIKTGQIARKLFVGGVLGQLSWFKESISKNAGLDVLGYRMRDFWHEGPFVLAEGVTVPEKCRAVCGDCKPFRL